MMALLMFSIVGCGNETAEKPNDDKKVVEEKKEETKAETPKEEKLSGELSVSAAASLTDAMNELITLFNKTQPDVVITPNYGSSGTLQTQIEEGAEVDLFLSAGQKQMKALIEKGLVDEADKKDILKNELVLIVPYNSTLDIASFEDLAKEEVGVVALGEPTGVPVGQYSEEVLTHLNILDVVNAKASFGSDVRQVLNWVTEGAVDAGVVYRTDAVLEGDKVTIAAAAPEGSHKPIVYPVATLKNSKNRDLSEKFEAFLFTDEAMKVFDAYGFKPAQ